MFAIEKIKSHYMEIREAFAAPEVFEEAERHSEAVDALLCKIESAELRSEIDILIGRLLVSHEVVGYTVAQLEAKEKMSRYREILGLYDSLFESHCPKSGQKVGIDKAKRKC